MDHTDCLMSGCMNVNARCEHCGHNRKERDRRLAIPLTEGPDGLRRKYVGIPKEKGEACDERTEAEPEKICDNPCDEADV